MKQSRRKRCRKHISTLAMSYSLKRIWWSCRRWHGFLVGTPYRKVENKSSRSSLEMMGSVHNNKFRLGGYFMSKYAVWRGL